MEGTEEGNGITSTVFVILVPLAHPPVPARQKGVMCEVHLFFTDISESWCPTCNIHV